MKHGKADKQLSIPVACRSTLGKAAPGTHNRRARRAAKAQQGLFGETETEEQKLRAMWAAFGRHQERARLKREAFWAAQTDDDILDMSLAQGEQEGEHVASPFFLPLLFEAVPRWCARHYTTDPDARIRRAHELGPLIGAQGGACIVDKDSAPVTKGEGSTANVFNAIAEGLAIGAYCPGGARFCGMQWEAQGAQLIIRNRAFCARYPLDDPDYWNAPPKDLDLAELLEVCGG